jgi:hypothetical protein
VGSAHAWAAGVIAGGCHAGLLVGRAQVLAPLAPTARLCSREHVHVLVFVVSQYLCYLCYFFVFVGVAILRGCTHMHLRLAGEISRKHVHVHSFVRALIPGYARKAYGKQVLL